MDNQNQHNTINGPVFEIAPGWGFKIKKWFKKNSRVVFPALIGIVLAIGLIAVFRDTGTPEKPVVAQPQNRILEVVGRGDGQVHIARRALADYIENSNLGLTPAQKIFIEQVLAEKMGTREMTAGEKIEFSIGDIETAIDRSKNLTPTQLKKWEAYARTVRF
jgi:hypothetical protein